MTSEQGIWIITNENSESDVNTKSGTERSASSKGFFDDDPQTEDNQGDNGSIVSVNTLQENLAKLLNNIDESLANINEQKTKSGFKIDEIELSVGINGKGKVGILGMGAEAGSNASIKLKLKRQN